MDIHTFSGNIPLGFMLWLSRACGFLGHFMGQCSLVVAWIHGHVFHGHLVVEASSRRLF